MPVMPQGANSVPVTTAVIVMPFPPPPPQSAGVKEQEAGGGKIADCEDTNGVEMVVMEMEGATDIVHQASAQPSFCEQRVVDNQPPEAEERPWRLRCSVCCQVSQVPRRAEAHFIGSSARQPAHRKHDMTWDA
jgi:hypothetical protein